MTTATYTIDATHLHRRSTGADSEDPPDRQGGVDQAPHPALHLADRGHGHGHLDRPWGRSSVVSQVQRGPP